MPPATRNKNSRSKKAAAVSSSDIKRHSSKKQKTAIGIMDVDADDFVKQQQDGDTVTIEEEAIAEFDLIPIDDGTTKTNEEKKKIDCRSWTKYLKTKKKQKKIDPRSWTEYLALRRKLQDTREKSYYADEDGGTGGYYANEDDDDAQRARRKVQEFLDDFLTQKSSSRNSGTMDTNLAEDWKKGMYLEVSAARSDHVSYDDDDGFQQLTVRTTFFSPFAVPRAVEVEMFYLKECCQEITVKLLSFDPPPKKTEEAAKPAKKEKKGQTIVSIHLAPKRKINVKNLNEKKVTQLCKHLEIHTDTKTSNADDGNDDGNDDDTAADSIMRRYILMRLLFSTNDYADQGEAGFYGIDREKFKDYLEKKQKMEKKEKKDKSKKPKKETNRKNNDDTSSDGDDDDAKEGLLSWLRCDSMTWLDYHIRVATNYVKPYYPCLKLITRDTDDDLVDTCDY